MCSGSRQVHVPNRLVAGAIIFLILAVYIVVLYAPGLQSWFQRDDFWWLTLRSTVHTPCDLWQALFTPMAQGTIRVWSERVYFLLARDLYGTSAFWYHMTSFLAMLVAAGGLVGAVYSLTKNAIASVTAAIVWLSNPALAMVFGWASAFNQALSSVFFMGCTLLLIRYERTRNYRDALVLATVFVLGFGASELMVCFAGVALIYALVRDRRLILAVLPLAGIAAVFAAAHFFFIKKPNAGPYLIEFGPRMWNVFARYWTWVIGPGRLILEIDFPRPVAMFFVGVLTLAILAFVASRTRRGDRLPLWCLAWYVSAIGPFLLLPHHLMDYYLTVPALGLAILAGLAIHHARWSTAGIIALYLAGSLPAARARSEWVRDESLRVRTLVDSVEAIRRMNPNSRIVLTAASDELLRASISQLPFRALGRPEPFYTDSASSIELALRTGPVRVVSVRTGVAEDVTDMYRSK
jgi:hypothetical protein